MPSLWLFFSYYETQRQKALVSKGTVWKLWGEVRLNKKLILPIVTLALLVVIIIPSAYIFVVIGLDIPEEVWETETIELPMSFAYIILGLTMVIVFGWLLTINAEMFYDAIKPKEKKVN